MNEGFLTEFIGYVDILDGDEKGEAQVFLDRFFQAFGHKGYKEAGATLEKRVRKKNKNVAFADLCWEDRLLLEMKKRGENLQLHYDQVRDYWYDLYPKPKYVVLCNFDEFWIYNFLVQSDPVDRVLVKSVVKRSSAFNFMLAKEKEPVFRNNMEEVSRVAADKVARVFNSLVSRGKERDISQRFILQCVLSMFAEDFGLLPSGLFTELIDDCCRGESSYDLFGMLFRQMNTPTKAEGGRFKDVDYFNGGVFSEINPIDLTKDELFLLKEAAEQDWSKVQPPIFGALFEGSMGKEERHALGAHFTYEADIKKIVIPTLERPWKERIDKASTLKELKSLRDELMELKVLDPSCGCGNFLYVAYREVRRLEMIILAKVHSNFKERARREVGSSSRISLSQFFGIDINSFAVELAKVTLMLAKEQSIEEFKVFMDNFATNIEFDFEPPLPLENLDENVICDDALFCNWPEADVIIGNPPYQSKNKLQQELGVSYVAKVRERFPDVPGRADYCVYWFRRSHDELKEGGMAGLVGTNTVRQNYSREGGLDYIVGSGGVIFDAVSSQIWSGEAVVYVSIVNWIKGEYYNKKILFCELGYEGSGNFEKYELDFINSSLSRKIDLSQASKLDCNKKLKVCFQGQTHGHEGFLLSVSETNEMIENDKSNEDVIYPYFISDELLKAYPPKYGRYVIDFHPMDVLKASKYKEPLERIKKLVLPTRENAAKEEKERNEELLSSNPKARINRHHSGFLRSWWTLSYPRENLMNSLNNLSRYIVCARHTKRPVFEFVDVSIHPGDSLQVFAFEDDYSFGVLQSIFHWEWFQEKCSTIKGDPRYTSSSVFDTFPWPQDVSLKNVEEIAKCGLELRNLRNEVMKENNWGLRALYRSLDLPGKNRLRDAHKKLDEVVRRAYGMKKKDDLLSFLLSLNGSLFEKEKNREEVFGPGLPSFAKKELFISEDRVV